MVEPSASQAAEPGAEEPRTGPPAPDGGADLARRRFFREFAGEIATSAATVLGAAQALQRTSAELAGQILEPTRVDEPPAVAVAAAAQPEPTFRTAFRLEGATIRFVDQRRLPGSIVEHGASSAAEVTYAIRNGVVLGGPAAGQAAALGLALTAFRVRTTRPYARRATFRGAANALRNAAPSNGAVASAVTRVMAAYAAVGELSDDGEAIAAAMRAEADAIVAEAVADHGALVEAGLAWLDRLPRRGEGPDGADLPVRLLIHGPGGTLAGGQFGTALSIATTAHQRDRAVSVIVPEGRPRLGGSRVSAWELAAAGVRHLLVADAAAPSLIAAGEVDAVLVPAERVAANGDVAAAVGTYAIAVVAARHGVPVVACVADSVVDPATADGNGITIGHYPIEDLDRIGSTTIAPPDTDARVPSHDITPAELITTWLTADGPHRPPFVAPASETPSAPVGDPA
jgi:methylthioribose-1-phosphate isomerase